MINEFLKTYKYGGMVYLDPTERDCIVEEINRLKKIDESHQRINGELREENDIAQEKVKSAIKEIERLNNIIKEVRTYIENHKNMTQGSFNGKEWTEQYFELVCDPKELLEILDKES